ncbi:hypothetical protein CLOM_g19492 [Closterium sp. NIES-68]|nr:hypothetical protein CLOM_g19492 [Closterium sp. NIES-68]
MPRQLLAELYVTCSIPGTRTFKAGSFRPKRKLSLSRPQLYSQHLILLSVLLVIASSCSATLPPHVRIRESPILKSRAPPSALRPAAVAEQPLSKYRPTVSSSITFGSSSGDGSSSSVGVGIGVGIGIGVGGGGGGGGGGAIGGKRGNSANSSSSSSSSSNGSGNSGYGYSSSNSGYSQRKPRYHSPLTRLVPRSARLPDECPFALPIPLHQCALGYSQASRGGYGRAEYVVSSDEDRLAQGTLRWGLVRYRAVGVYVRFNRNMEIRLRGPLWVGSHVTLDGRGVRVRVAGGALVIRGSTSIIIHNLHFADVTRSPSAPQNLISIRSSQDIWIDHCTLQASPRALISLSRFSTNVTISNSHLRNGGDALVTVTPSSPHLYPLPLAGARSTSRFSGTFSTGQAARMSCARGRSAMWQIISSLVGCLGAWLQGGVLLAGLKVQAWVVTAVTQAMVTQRVTILKVTMELLRLLVQKALQPWEQL